MLDTDIALFDLLLDICHVGKSAMFRELVGGGTKIFCRFEKKMKENERKRKKDEKEKKVIEKKIF